MKKVTHDDVVIIIHSEDGTIELIPEEADRLAHDILVHAKAVRLGRTTTYNPC